MAINLYDTRRRRVLPFEPQEPGHVSMYVCGPTVYNYVHIGNARTFVWYDFIRRYLAYRGFDVTYVMNYTDVDDKIIERAKIEKLHATEIARKYEDAFEADMRSLGVEPPDILVRATEHIDDMIKAIEGLIERGAAYEGDGDVFFAVERFDGYGKLSGRSLEDLRAERIDPHPGKRHPADFALWKSAKEEEPAWESPWGPGRPGWHIECSVMSTRYLGMGFDIHGGGSDLIFPHHENEIAQAEALSGREFVRYWPHAGMVQMEFEKMSKSLGNVVLAKEVVETYSGEVARYWALMASYRSQVTFSEETLTDAGHAFHRWRTFYEIAQHALSESMPAGPASAPRLIGEDDSIKDPFLRTFIECLDDDFNSAGAFAAVHDLVREANKRVEPTQRADEAARRELVRMTGTFLEMVSVLGIDLQVARPGSSELTAGLIELLLELREQARADRAFERADAIRARLGSLGVVVEDTPTGPRWRLETSSG